MPTVGIRELANNTSAVVDEVARSGRPALVTRHGRPVAAVVPVDEEELLDYVLANAPEYVRSMAEADAALARGERGVSLADYEDHVRRLEAAEDAGDTAAAAAIRAELAG
ncbi:MAG: type II toxin-antitoxin system Phd/YefM family antitoxin [Acidimicrobiales bacterium]